MTKGNIVVQEATLKFNFKQGEKFQKKIFKIPKGATLLSAVLGAKFSNVHSSLGSS